jgi:hypothetical protein
MSSTAASRFAREVLAKLLGSLPDYTIKAIGAFLRWYWRLGMLPMFLVTAVMGAATLSVLPTIIPSETARLQAQHTVGALLVAWVLIVLIVGVIRPGRR